MKTVLHLKKKNGKTIRNLRVLVRIELLQARVYDLRKHGHRNTGRNSRTGAGKGKKLRGQKFQHIL